MNFIFITGTTCSGKSTAIDYITKNYRQFGCIKIGEEMRRRHPPEYFKGKCALEETEEEVWQIFDESARRCKADGKTHVLVDGVPRLISQVDHIADLEFNGELITRCKFIILKADEAEIDRRAAIRDRNDKSRMDLTLQRIVNDKIIGYDVVLALISLYPDSIEVLDTTGSTPEEIGNAIFQKSLMRH